MYAMIFTGYETTSGLERVTGAHRMATVLRKEGCDTEVIDFFYSWELAELKELIKIRNQKHKIDWLGFSCTWLVYLQPNTMQRLLDFLVHIKTEYPDIKIIAGGQNHSLHFPMYQYIDYVIEGFAEKAMVELLKYIYSNGKIKGEPRKNGWYINANSFYPGWPISDLSIDFEDRDFIYPNESIGIELSRGCKFSCAFCNFPVLGVKEDTTRDLTQLETELKRNYDKYGIQNYNIADETFNDRDEKILKIGNIVQSLDFEVNFSAFVRADLLISRPQQLELMSNARVWGHYYGIETFNRETGKVIGKGLDPERMKEGLLNIKNHFNKSLGRYRGTVSLIYGLPKDTKESIENAIDWLANNWRDNSVLAFPLNISLTGNKSKIDNNYEKYGYTFESTEKRETLKPRNNFFANDLTVWKNDNMDVYDAIDLVDKQYEAHKPNIPDNWSLWALLPMAESIEEAMATNSFNKNPHFKTKAKEIKRQYIQKKLSL